MEGKEISDLVQQEIARVHNTRVADKIRELLVFPYAVERPWDYGEPNERFPCWTVLEHTSSIRVPQC